MQGKHVRPQRNLNLKLIVSSCLCYEADIHYTVVTLSSSDLEMAQNDEENQMRKSCFKKYKSAENRKSLSVHALRSKNVCHILLCQRH